MESRPKGYDLCEQTYLSIYYRSVLCLSLSLSLSISLSLPLFLSFFIPRSALFHVTPFLFLLVGRLSFLLSLLLFFLFRARLRRRLASVLCCCLFLLLTDVAVADGFFLFACFISKLSSQALTAATVEKALSGEISKCGGVAAVTGVV